MKNYSTLRNLTNINLLICMLLVTTAYADNASLISGDELARNINARSDGISLTRNMTMELTDRRGKKRVRKTKVFRKYYGSEKRTVIHFLSPRNIKKTAFLTFDYLEASKDDAQWLYLPAMRKVRRISASDRGDYFLGTDFTYEDIKKDSKVSIEDYKRTTLRVEEFDGRHSYIMESIPVNEKTAEELGYGKVVQWVDAEIWMVRKAEFFDVRGNPLKTVYTKDISKVQDIWTAHRLEAISHKTGHKTVLIFSNVIYDKELRDDLFTQRALRHGL